MPEYWLAILANLSIKATILLLAAWACSLWLRRASAAARHVIWTLTVAGLLVLPVLSVVLPGWRVAPVNRVKAATPQILSRPSHAATPLEKAPSLSLQSAAVPAMIPRVLLLVWAAGVTLVLGRLLIGMARASKMVRRARRVQIAMAGELARRLGLHRHVVFRESDGDAAAPMTWGLWRATIVLPEGASKWPDERLRVVLIHELAHVERRDCLIQFVTQLACAAYWFHPLVWLAAAQLRRERERACDDRVLEFGTRPSDYAEQLLELVHSQRLIKESWPIAVAMAQPSHLERRLLAMLDSTVSRRSLTRTRIAAAVLAAACLIVPLAALRAQAGVGRLSGAVQDPSGARVPRATVTVSNAAGKEIATTSEAGEYDFASLPEGSYTLQARQPGFALFERSVVIEPNRQARFDITLLPGRVSETIEVVGKAPAPTITGAPRRIRVGGNIQATKLITAPRVAYPEHLQQQGIQGSVLLDAVIGKDGSLMGLKVVNTLANPELAKAAMDAVQNWRYQPTLLNGEPVEVITTITVNFRLAP